MASPLVRSIVVKSTVTLPVAGTVGTFTPFINTNNVIGVKSGRTAAAGGCDVMAMTFRQGSTTRVLYVVILGQRGGNLLGPAGDAALALADSAVGHQLSLVFPSAERVATIGWASHVTPVQLAQRHEIWWWAAQGPLSLSVALKHFTSTIRRGQLVGWLVVRGPATYRFALVAGATVSAPTLWQRLR
jgi:hypothetical protein